MMAGRHRATRDRPSWLSIGWTAPAEVPGVWQPQHADTNRQPGIRDIDAVPDEDLIPGMRHPDDADGWAR